jgi:L-threonylcarbamoyladenylate synthase
MTARLVADNPAGRLRAEAVLRRGGLVVLPTDTVYGLGVALNASRGIERLFEAKGRPPDKAITLLVADASQTGSIAVFGPAAACLARAGWPGGLTLVLRQKPGAALPAILTAGTDTIGLRMPDHEAPRALAAALGPLPVTSANRSGDPTPATAAEVAAVLGAAVDLILDGGPSRSDVPSTVVDCSGDRPVLLRAGAVPAAVLAAALDAAGLAHDLPRDNPASPRAFRA